ncbi:MAG: ABC transporter ATP-binding protein [Lachnospiraceae bacterium]|nr:ABC transporter ATP-binding protein [Lachnospiraceae bacterium]
MKRRAKAMSLKQMWEYVLFQSNGYKLAALFVIVGTVCGAGYAYVNSILYARILDILIIENYDRAIYMVVIMIVAVWILMVLEALSKIVVDTWMDSSDYETKKRTAKKVFTMQYEKVEREETLSALRKVRMGELSEGGIAVQLDAIYSFFTYIVKTVFSTAFLVTLIIKASFGGNVNVLKILILTLLLAGFMALIAYLSVVIAWKLGEKGNEMSEKNVRGNSEFNYLTSFMFSDAAALNIRLYDCSDYIIKKCKLIIDSMKIWIEYGRYKGIRNGILGIIMQLLAAYIYIYMAVVALGGIVTTGEVLMYAGAAITMVASIQGMLGLYNSIVFRNKFLKTYEEFIEDENMSYDGTLPIEKRDDNRYELAFKGVSFKYPGCDEYILKNVSIKFNIGERIALVGLNGAGKTTLIKLLMRFYEPTEGEITLNGIDIRKYDYNEYVSIFAPVFQDFALFDFPIDENIAGSIDVNEVRLKRAIKDAQIEDVIEKLPDKVHTRLGHHNGEGTGLSGGEKQKVAIARALYKDAPFVIIDEPTAALDPVAEAEVYENFDKLVGNKTSIYISHRMSSCKFCDRIVVLDGGKIAEEGNHKELLAQDGIYAKLYNTQAEYYTA